VVAKGPPNPYKGQWDISNPSRFGKTLNRCTGYESKTLAKAFEGGNHRHQVSNDIIQEGVTVVEKSRTQMPVGHKKTVYGTAGIQR